MLRFSYVPFSLLEDGYLEGGDCVVSWCLGHLAEYAAPEHYDERYENWRFEDLPITLEWLSIRSVFLQSPDISTLSPF